MSFNELASFPCLACGAQVPAGNRFCGSCGSAVNTSGRGRQNAFFQPYVDRGYPFRARRRGSVKGKWVGLGIFFFCSLLFALGGWLPAFINFPGFQARFVGVETTGLASAAGDCDDGSYYMYTFTDSHGKVYQITDHTCSSGIVSDGEHVTLWYRSDNPAQFITANDLNFDLIFIVTFSIPLAICIVLVVIVFIRQLFVQRVPGLISLLGA
ncbi:MAG TPA: zinc ribbon domain-containing protein [Ktedonobacteraceae bacterium]